MPLNDNYSSYPENCPPSDARPVNLDIYYYVRTTDLTPDDFPSAYQRGAFLTKCPCLRRSISCGVSELYLDEVKKKNPVFNYWKRVVGTVEVQDGLIKQTYGPSHHSYWINQTAIATFYWKFRFIL